MRLADLRIYPAALWGAYIGALLGVARNRRSWDKASRSIQDAVSDLGTVIGTRWRESDARDDAMLAHTRTLRRFTVWIALLTVVNTGFVIYSAVR